MVSAYPARDRSAWIVAQRPPRTREPDPEKPHGVFLEREKSATGAVVSSGVVLLTNKECPWRCLMCDLWKDTTSYSVPAGAIPRQIDFALAAWAAEDVLPAQVKLYNSGSFFDPAAIPTGDYAAIAGKLAFARNVVVESHPRLIGRLTLQLRDMLSGSLEVAMGLETAHPETLERLNKNFDLAQFAHAAELLRREGIALRAFVLVKPPFMDEAQGLEWAVKSAEFAFSCGASAVSLIPTRGGNGAMERLLATGEFTPPRLSTLENALSGALALKKGRVFADTWGLEAFSTCPKCFAARQRRLHAINLAQEDQPCVRCPDCDGQ